MIDRISKIFDTYDVIATSILAVAAAVALGVVSFRWLAKFYAAGAWMPFALISAGLIGVIGFVIWAIYHRWTAPLFCVFVLLVLVGVSLFTTSNLGVFLP